jgi:hypothetical protein
MATAGTKSKQSLLTGHGGAIESFQTTTPADASGGLTIDSVLSEIWGVQVFSNTSTQAGKFEATWDGNTITITGANAGPQNSCLVSVLVTGRL